jgi:hypothetical protein
LWSVLAQKRGESPLSATNLQNLTILMEFSVQASEMREKMTVPGKAGNLANFSDAFE